MNTLPNWDAVHADARRVLEAVAAKHGIAIAVKGGTYTGTNFRFSLEFATIASDGVVMSKDARNFLANSRTFGIEPSALGKIITLKGDEYRIVGLNTRSVKRPIKLISLTTGSSWSWSAGATKRALDNPPAPPSAELLAITLDVGELLS